jgi:hypothetical protein
MDTDSRPPVTFGFVAMLHEKPSQCIMMVVYNRIGGDDLKVPTAHTSLALRPNTDLRVPVVGDGILLH